MLKRIGQAFVVALGYGAMGALIGASPFLVLYAIWPRTCEPGEICEGGSGDLVFIALPFFGAIVFFILGFAFSMTGLKPFTRTVSAVVRNLRRLGGWPAVAALTVVLLSAFAWVGVRAASGPPQAEMVNLHFDMRFDPKLGVGLRLIEMSLSEEGCVTNLYTSPVDEESGYFTVAWVALPASDDTVTYGDVCFRGKWPTTNHFLVVLYDDADEPGTPLLQSSSVLIRGRPRSPESELFIEAMPDDLVDPVVIPLEPVTAEVDGQAWRISVKGVGDGLVVPIIQEETVPAGVEIRVSELVDSGSGGGAAGPSFRIGDSHGTGPGSPIWSAVCERTTCELGWVIQTSGLIDEPAAITWTAAVWAFNTDSDLVVEIQDCTLVGDRQNEVVCAPPG